MYIRGTPSSMLEHTWRPCEDTSSIIVLCEFSTRITAQIRQCPRSRIIEKVILTRAMNDSCGDVGRASGATGPSSMERRCGSCRSSSVSCPSSPSSRLCNVSSCRRCVLRFMKYVAMYVFRNMLRPFVTDCSHSCTVYLM